MAQRKDSIQLTLPVHIQQDIEMGKVIVFTGLAGAMISSYLIDQNKKIPEFYPGIFIGVSFFGTFVEMKALIKSRRKIRKKRKILLH